MTAMSVVISVWWKAPVSIGLFLATLVMVHLMTVRFVTLRPGEGYVAHVRPHGTHNGAHCQS